VIHNNTHLSRIISEINGDIGWKSTEKNEYLISKARVFERSKRLKRTQSPYQIVRSLLHTQRICVARVVAPIHGGRARVPNNIQHLTLSVPVL